MTNECIRIDHISKKYGVQTVLKDLNAVLKKGEILGFLGPSGAGKTTTIKILTGQLAPTSGNAYVLGIHVKNIDETIYEQIGIVTDQSGIYERLSVYENMKYFAKIRKVDKSRIDDLLERVGLSEHKKKPAGKLSKGQSQRLILARALMHRPQILFLDEPTSGLDPSTALAIHRLLLELKEEGMAVFLTTHNMEEASKLCSHVSLLNDGEIVEYGTPQELCLRYNKKKRYKVLLENGKQYVLEQTEDHMKQLALWLVKGQTASVHSLEPTLEDVFLTVTGRNLQ